MNVLGPLCSSSPSSSPSACPRSSASSRAVTARRRSPDSHSCSVCSVSCCCRPYSHRRPGRGFNKPVFTTALHTPLAHESIKCIFTFATNLRVAVKRLLFSHDEQRRASRSAPASEGVRRKSRVSSRNQNAKLNCFACARRATYFWRAS